MKKDNEELKKRIEWLEMKLDILETTPRAKEIEERPAVIMETADYPPRNRIKQAPVKRQRGKR